MAIKVQFEIGHKSNLKNKIDVKYGFTHDWEVFVRGVGNGDISEFCEKVVFNLHESFRKPKRTIKEPPYVLKESGYAGFQLSIEIHFKNREEPKKVTFYYDLDLNQTKPYQRSEKKDYIFENPSDEFRQMLKSGGGVVVVAGNTVGANRASIGGNPIPDDRNQFVGKPKVSSDSLSAVKKIKPRTDDHFTNLFGTPITKTTAKVSPDHVKGKISPPAQPKYSSTSSSTKDSKSTSSTSSSEIPKEKSKKDKHKHNSPYKEKDSSSSSSKYEKRDDRSDKKKYSKERGRSHEKSSKDRPPSPPSNQPRSSSAASRDDPNSAKSSKSSSASSSSKKSKKEKKDKDRDRERSERKEKEKRDKEESKPSQIVSASGQSQSSTPTIPVSSETPTSNHSASSKSNNTPINNKRLDKLSPKEPIKSSTPVHVSSKHPSSEKDDKEKQRHKHKKKDKTRDKDSVSGAVGSSSSTGSSREHSNKEKKKEKSISGKTSVDKPSDQNPTPTHKQHVSDREEEPTTVHHSESSNSSFPEIPKITTPKETSASPAAPLPPPPPQKKERKSKGVPSSTVTLSSAASSNKDPAEKIKRRRESIAVSSFVEPPAKQTKTMKNGHDKSPGDEANLFRPPAPAPAPAIIQAPPTQTHLVAPDYMAELQELHHKIMTLQDNKELQHVVELIAETGNYEITSRTFDFDLCKLDRNTVQRLQDFFAASAAS